METYGQILNIAMPIFLVFVLAEKAYGWWKEKAPLRLMDTISSLSSGLTNVLKDVLGLSVAVLAYGTMVEHLALTHIQSGVWTYVIAFIALDFSGYWVHRISHKVNFFWNRHLIHHSSEEFNLACALRQSISVFVQLFTFFLLPAALLGVPNSVIATVAPLHLFAQFWYHTIYIGKMGWLEYLIVTPSQHRVHHAINPIYIDKNYGNIFTCWDRWFGTFQEELDEVPPVYGITKPVSTWNPIKINFQHLASLARDAWHARSWRDKLRLWWMPTGWRPADVAERFPSRYIEDVYNFQKYDPPSSAGLIGWSAVQFFFHLFSNGLAIWQHGPHWQPRYFYLRRLFVLIHLQFYGADGPKPAGLAMGGRPSRIGAVADVRTGRAVVWAGRRVKRFYGGLPGCSRGSHCRVCTLAMVAPGYTVSLALTPAL